MPSKQRDEYWDAVKGTLMLLVVFGHFLQIGLSRLGGGYPLIEALLCSIYVLVPSRFLRTFGRPYRPAFRCGPSSGSVTSMGHDNGV